MTQSAIRNEVLVRSSRMLRTALGPQIAGWLDDPQVVEVMLNPDGRLWLDRLTTGLAATGIVERDVLLALQPALCIPRGLAVSDHVDEQGGSLKCVSP